MEMRKIWTYLWALFRFTVSVKCSASQKISVQNLAIMGMFYMLFLFLCNILESYLLLGNESCRFRREILNQSPPIREILSDYQLNLMSFVKIHPRQTNAIQCSVLCPRIIRRHTYYVSRGARSCTPVFHPQQWNIPRHIVCRQATFLIEMVT